MSVTLPYTITNGTPHDGAQVQANFAALRDGHNAHVHNGTDTPAVDFANVTGKPAAYPPSAHAASHAEGGADAADAASVDTFHASATATANKLLALNADGKLPASITGDAATVAGLVPGNASGNIPISNGTLCTNLNAEFLGGWRRQELMPSGAVMAFAMSTPPSGWLECNGAAVSRTTYAALFAAIGTTFGAGDGSTTFNLPNLRGEFIRGWDNGRGVDAGRAFGSWQADEFKSHTHTVKVGYGSPNGPDGGTYKFFDLTGESGAAGGAETRPRNVALMYCIKY